MYTYLNLLKQIDATGIEKLDRTLTGTKSLIGCTLRMDLNAGFPLLTTKFVSLKTIFTELNWFLSGSENIQSLNDKKNNIWNEWADGQKNIGPMYGSQWINWNYKGINQIDYALDKLKTDPNSRRIIVSAWNPEYLPNEALSPIENVRNGKMALAPCHAMFQLLVNDNKLSCIFYQRSSDVFLGLPYNIASYAILTHILAQQTNLGLGELIFMGGDCHLYLNHLEQAHLQINRIPYDLPKLQIKRKPSSIYEYEFEDLVLINYNYHPKIYAPISI